MHYRNNILLTGRPGIGKTTLICRLAENLGRFHPNGFYTREIRTGRTRRGFELIDLRGGRLVLSHVDFTGHYRVGKYGVDINRFDQYLQQHNFAECEAGLVIIDEIGKMECYSRMFVEMMEQLLDSEKILVATIARAGGGAIARIKDRPDKTMIEITTGNRNSLADQLADSISHML